MRNLQEKWAAFRVHPERVFIVLDEMSLCGQESLFWIDSRARQATGQNKPFGGFSLILAGDFGQLPPVEDHAMFEEPGNYARRVRGLGLYSLFNDVVQLTENIRSKNQKWRDLLLRIRDGITTRADYQWLSTRFKNDDNYAEYEDALHLFYQREKTSKHNMLKLHKLQNPICNIKSINVPAKAKNAKDTVARNLHNELLLSVGSKVMLTTNLWQKCGLINGTCGTIVDFVYNDRDEPPTLPVAVMVQFDETYKGPSFEYDTYKIDRLVPICPFEGPFLYHKASATRTQIPLMLCYAQTIHKSQGTTCTKVVADIGDQEPPLCPGLAFVALSRGIDQDSYLLVRFDNMRLNQVRGYKRFRSRIRACHVLDQKALKTKLRHGIHVDVDSLVETQASASHLAPELPNMNPQTLSPHETFISTLEVRKTLKDLDIVKKTTPETIKSILRENIDLAIRLISCSPVHLKLLWLRNIVDIAMTVYEESLSM